MQRGLTEKDRRRSASNECKALRDVVSKLRTELLQSQVERQKLQDQLQCMIYLVRRAWQGDEIASIHIANIVGMAPPKIEKSSNFADATSTPKSRALNGWVRLVIGLLNRMYREEELELRAQQLVHLRRREELLDEQLMTSNKGVIPQRQTNISAVQMSTLELLRAKEEQKARHWQEERGQLERQKQELQAQLKRRKPPISHLYDQGHSTDGAEKDAKLDVSQNFLIAPVGSKEECSMPNMESTANANGLTQGIDERTSRNDASALSGIDSETKSSEDVSQTRKRTSSSSHDDESLAKDKNDSRHVRSQTCHGTGKRGDSHSRPRPKTAVVMRSTSGSSGVGRKQRPVSAHLPPSQSSPAFDTSKTKRQLDLIERDLKLTCKALQDRLGISKPGLV